MVLAPVWWWATSFPLLMVYIQLPLYMLHQWEEHAGDRFRTFVNELLGGGKEVLTRPATFVINSAGVWGVDILAIMLAVFGEPSLGLMGIYLTLINAVMHIGQGIKLRRYNPGLCTGVALFVPAGLLGLLAFRDAGFPAHAFGIAVGVLLHAVIIVHVKRRLGDLKGEPAVRS